MYRRPNAAGLSPRADKASLEPQRVDRAEARRLVRRVVAEEDAYGRSAPERQEHGAPGHDRGPLHHVADAPRRAETQDDPERPAPKREDNRLDEKLQQHVDVAGANRE